MKTQHIKICEIQLKAIGLEKCIALGDYIRKQSRFQVNYLSFYSKKLEEQNKQRASKRKETIKIEEISNKDQRNQ